MSASFFTDIDTFWKLALVRFTRVNRVLYSVDQLKVVIRGFVTALACSTLGSRSFATLKSIFFITIISIIIIILMIIISLITTTIIIIIIILLLLLLLLSLFS